MDPEKILQEVFGLPGFRQGQRDIIDTVLDGRDCIAVMATGGGKSLCYQLPGYMLPGLIIVVTPIISLMADQVKRLSELNIPAGYLSSMKTRTEQERDIEDLKRGRFKFILVSPERLSSKVFMNALREQTVGLLAIDEAHCISQWGHDFRPDYLNIGQFRKEVGNPRCIALTGTATPAVQSEIGRYLEMEKPRLFLYTFNRPNLRYLVYREKEIIDKIDRLRLLLTELRGTGIIYCSTRKEVEFISDLLNKWGLDCLPYHAGLPAAERTENQDRWIRGETPLISATNAFGMGIDKPDVRFVIHFSMSSSMENYYQEAGRAGRDGEAALCIVLFSSEDLRMLRVREKILESNPLIDSGRKKHLQNMADSCRNYLFSETCRRSAVLEYFHEEFSSANCASCDVCMEELGIPPRIRLMLPDADERALRKTWFSREENETGDRTLAVRHLKKKTFPGFPNSAIRACLSENKSYRTSYAALEFLPCLSGNSNKFPREYSLDEIRAMRNNGLKIPVSAASGHLDPQEDFRTIFHRAGVSSEEIHKFGIAPPGGGTNPR